MSKQDSYLSKKLFGPFNGLNDSLSPFLRELPPAPNAKPREYATEFQNLEIDEKTQELISRLGIEYVTKDTPNAASGEIRATSGIFKWIDYDNVTGLPRQRGVQIVVDEDGAPTVYVYRFIKTEVRITDNSLNGKKFAIIEDPDASRAKKFMIYNANDSVFASYSSLAAVTNTSTSYIDWDTDLDGPILTSAVDLLAPVTMTYSASNGTPTSVASFYSLAVKTVTPVGDLDLSSWIDSLDDSDAVYFTAAQSNNVLYFSGGGVCPILKYDGISLYKAGMPNAAVGGRLLYETLAANDFETTYSETIDNIFEGLMNPSSSANRNNLGNFIYIYAYERGDAKNNYIEGQAFLNGTFSAEDSLGSPVLGVTITPEYKALRELLSSGGVVSGNVLRYKPPSLGPSGTYDNGFEPRAAVVSSNQITTSDPGANFTIPTTGTSTLKKNDIFCMRATLHTDNTLPDADGYRFPVLITGRIAAVGASTTTIDYNYPISIEIVPGGDIRANALDGALSDLTEDTTQALLSSLQSITTWEGLFAWDWLGYAASTKMTVTTEFVISNNFRINVYRNKANENEGNAYDPYAANGTFIPDFYLVNILPNDPFNTTTSMGRHYDNCKDSCLGALYTPKVPLLIEDKGTTDLNDIDYSPLPKGRGVAAFKSRLYITDDPLNKNILWRSDLLYGTEWFSSSDAINVESSSGDSALQTVGNNNVIYVLKDNGVKSILFDLDNENIRIDDYIVGDYGLIAPRSVATKDKAVIYLSSTGPVVIQVEMEPSYLGDNNNGNSRIRERLQDSTLDKTRAVGYMDNEKNQYVLYVPSISKPSVGLYNPANIRHADNPYYNDQGTTFVYSFSNDSWSEWAGINAKGGIVELNGRFLYLAAYAKNTSESVSTLEWVLYKDRAYDCLWSYADRLERGGTEELREISHIYTTDWLAMDDPSILKKFLRCKLYQLNHFDDLTVLGSSSTPLVASGDVTFTITAYKDWRADDVHSQSSVDLSSTNLYAFMKVRTNKASVMKFKLTHSELYASPKLQAIEVECAAPFKPRMKPWSVS